MKKYFILPVLNMLFFSFIQYNLSHVVNHRGLKFQISFLDYSLFYMLLSGPFLLNLKNKQIPSVLFLSMFIISEFVLLNFTVRKIFFSTSCLEEWEAPHTQDVQIWRTIQRNILGLSLPVKMDAINLLWYGRLRNGTSICQNSHSL